MPSPIVLPLCVLRSRSSAVSSPTSARLPDGAAFLVLEDDHLQRVPGHEVVRRQRPRDLDRAERPDVAVVVAAVGHRVDVRPEHERLERGHAPGPPADDVAGGVDAHRETRLAHHVHRPLAALPVELRVGHAADAAVRILPELRQFAQLPVDALAIDAKRWREGRPFASHGATERDRADSGRQLLREASSIHDSAHPGSLPPGCQSWIGLPSGSDSLAKRPFG